MLVLYFFLVPCVVIAALTVPLTFTLSTVAAAALHEGGHLAAIFLLGDKSGRAELSAAPFGFVIKRKGIMLPYYKELIIYSAGCAANILCAVLTMVFAAHSGADFFVAANFSLAFLNLLPIKSLDGGGILLCSLQTRIMPDNAERICRAVSAIFSVLLWVVSVYLVMRFGAAHYLLFLSVYFLVLSKRAFQEK